MGGVGVCSWETCRCVWLGVVVLGVLMSVSLLFGDVILFVSYSVC